MKSFIREGLRIVNEIPIEDMQYIDEIITSKRQEDAFIPIGEGGSGKVYRYKKYAIKLFHDHAKSDGDPPYPHDGYFLSLLDRSPYFPSVYYYIEKEYMVVEFVEGQNIFDVEDRIFIKCIGCLREAINHAFSRGLIASDMIDANIIVNKKGIPMIVDVGSFYSVSYEYEIDNLVREYFTRYNEKILNSLAESRQEA